MRGSDRKPSASARWEVAQAIPIQTEAASLATLPVSSGGAWIGRPQKFEKGRVWTLEELLASGFTLDPWKGE